MLVHSDTFNLPQAHLLARASAVAYRRTPEEIAAEVGAEEVEVFAAGTVLGFTARRNSDTILAFRGTVNLGQWLTNANFAQEDAFGGRVHQGFLRALHPVWDEIVRQVRKAADGRLWLTGHSLGGALAILAAARLAEEVGLSSVVYSFGAPRVGDAAFASAYRPVLHRIEHGNDIVCHLPLPPALMKTVCPVLKILFPGGNWRAMREVSYYHVDRLTFIDWSGNIRPEVTGVKDTLLYTERVTRLGFVIAKNARGSLVSDHDIAAYVDRLGKATANQ